MNMKINFKSTNIKIDIILRMLRNSPFKIIVMIKLINQILETVKIIIEINQVQLKKISLFMIAEILTSQDLMKIPKGINFLKMISIIAL